MNRVGLWCLTQHSTVFQLYRGGNMNREQALHIYIDGPTKEDRI
jgi:hypothetical protein